MINIRLCKEDDLSSLSKVFADAFVQTYGHKWTHDQMRKTLNYFLEQQPDLFFVAEKDEKIVGGVWGRIVPWREGLHLKDTDMAVAAEYQRQGISKKLLFRMISDAIDKYNIVEFSGVANGKKEFPMSYYEKIGLKRTDWIFIYGNPKEMLERLKS